MIEKDGIKITQLKKCASMDLLAPRADLNSTFTFQYNKEGRSAYVGAGWETYYTNEDHRNCPLTSCQLKTADCRRPYADGYLSIGKCLPF